MWIGLLVLAVILTWLIIGIVALGFHSFTFVWFQEIFNEPTKVAIAFGFFGVLLAGIGSFVLYRWADIASLFSDFYANLATVFIDIAITVLVVDRVYAWRSAREEKRRILRQMASRSNEFAIEAVRLARNSGWLEDGSLKRIDLSAANLEGAILFRADLEGAVLINAILRRANLSGAIIKHVDLSCADLENADLATSRFEITHSVTKDLVHQLSYIKCIESLNPDKLDRTNLNPANLENVNFLGANLKNAKLMATNLSLIQWTAVNLDGVNMYKANLERSQFTIVSLEGASLEGATFKEIRFHVVNLKHASLKVVSFERTLFNDIDLRMTNLQQASFREASLNNVDLSESNLASTSFKRVLFCNVNLAQANLGSTKFDEVYYTSETKWPEGFDPIQAGMIFVNEDVPVPTWLTSLFPPYKDFQN